MLEHWLIELVGHVSVDALAGLAEMLPQPPLTRNQVELMQIDTTASENLPNPF